MREDTDCDRHGEATVTLAVARVAMPIVLGQCERHRHDHERGQAEGVRRADSVAFDTGRHRQVDSGGGQRQPVCMNR
jgi:hypothetical protein